MLGECGLPFVARPVNIGVDGQAIVSFMMIATDSIGLAIVDRQPFT